MRKQTQIENISIIHTFTLIVITEEMLPCIQLTTQSKVTIVGMVTFTHQQIVKAY